MEALGENPSPCFLQLLEAAHLPWLTAPWSIFKASGIATSLLSGLLPLSDEDPCDYIGPTSIIQDNLLIPRSLAHLQSPFDHVMGLRTCHPKIFHFGIFIILSWRQLRGRRCRTTFMIYPFLPKNWP